MDTRRPVESRTLHLRATRSAGWLVLWLLLLALPIQGAAGLLLGVLGSSHHHQRVVNRATSIEELRDFRRDAAVAHAAEPTHRHSLWQRHHHPRADGSVVALDYAAQEPATDRAGGSVANVTLGTPTSGPVAIAATQVSITAWPGYRGQRWRGPAAIPLERPPKA